MPTQPACRRALKRFAACIQVGSNGQWVDPAACWSQACGHCKYMSYTNVCFTHQHKITTTQQVSAALSACPAVDYNLLNPARQTFNYTDIPAYAVRLHAPSFLPSFSSCGWMCDAVHAFIPSTPVHLPNKPTHPIIICKIGGGKP